MKLSCPQVASFSFTSIPSSRTSCRTLQWHFLCVTGLAACAPCCCTRPHVLLLQSLISIGDYSRKRRAPFHDKLCHFLLLAIHMTVVRISGYILAPNQPDLVERHTSIANPTCARSFTTSPCTKTEGCSSTVPRTPPSLRGSLAFNSAHRYSCSSDSFADILLTTLVQTFP